MNPLLALSAAMMLLTGATHSIMGERRLIVPLLRMDQGVLASPLARMLIRFAWHLTTLLMAMTAAAVIWPGTPRGLIRLIGAGWLIVGLADAIVSRGKHIGWPMLAVAGLFALIA